MGGLVLAVPGWIAMVALINHLDQGQHTVLNISDLVLWPLLAMMALGASVVAAVVTAATQPGESSGDDAPPRRTWLAVGVGLLIIGLLGIASLRADSPSIATWATVLALGAVLLVPSLVHLIGRTAGALPLAARLSARDADRHRMRTAPAIAAVMVGVAAVTALGIGSFSDNHDRRAESEIYQFPVGAVSVYSNSDAEMVAAVAAAGASGVAGGSLLLIPMAASLFGIDNATAIQVVGVGFIIGVVQDSAETALNSSTDVLFTAAGSYKQGDPYPRKLPRNEVPAL